MFDHIPVGVGTKGVVPVTAAELNDVLVRFVVLVLADLSFCFAIYKYVRLSL